MQGAQDTRYQTAGYTELPYLRKKQKRCVPGSADFEDISALRLPRAARSLLACAGISCHSPLHTADCAVTVTLLFPHLCTSLSHAHEAVPSLQPVLVK